MEYDDMLANGSTSPEMFANDKPNDEAQEALDKERKELIKMFPTAEKDLAVLDDEIADVDRLSEFINCLGTMPTNLSEETLAAKLESRFAYLNLLIGRRDLYVQAIKFTKKDFEPAPIKFASLQKPLFVTHLEPRPRGWKAIRQGIRDLFGGEPM